MNFNNPVVPFSVDGFHKSDWFNYRQTQTGTVKAYEVRVYSNTRNTLGNALKRHLEHSIPKSDLSIGMRQPVYDPVSQGYYTTLIVLHGKNMHRGSFAPVKPKPVTGKQFDNSFDKGFQ